MYKFLILISSRIVTYGMCLSFLFYLSSCKSAGQDYYPPQHKDISKGTYDKYAGLLKKAYEVDDKIDVALQLSNLKADKSIIFKNLQSGIKKSPEECTQIYEWWRMYDKNDFAINLIKADTQQFRQAVNLCISLQGENSYKDHVAMKQKEAEDYKAAQPKEDSTAFNMTLVKKLEKINEDDQEVRIRLNKKSVTPAQREGILAEMHIIDSINLEKIDKIFKDHGYPSKTLVGKECSFTPALVIHHSNSLETRYKYLPLLEDAVEKGLLNKGTLNMINHRIKDMELAREN